GGETGDEDDDDLDRERCSVEQLEIRTGVDLTLRSIHACRLPQFNLPPLPRRHLPAATQRRPGRARPPPRLRPAGHGARCGPGSPPPAPRAFWAHLVATSVLRPGRAGRTTLGCSALLSP